MAKSAARRQEETFTTTTTQEDTNMDMNISNVEEFPGSTNGSVEVDILGTKVNLPVRFVTGHILTEAQAKVLDAAFQRQFRNNQEANAKARKAAGKPTFTAEELLTIYATYEPNVGSVGRMPSEEKLRREAAWIAWRNMVSRHNAAVAAGEEPVIVRAGSNPVALPSGKGAADKREALTDAILARPEYADLVQAEVDILMAARAKPEEKPNSVMVSVDLL